jgi:hypothetical protein
MSVRIESRTAVSMCEMARLVGLSRSRFYELIEAGVFPAPVYDLVTRRPYFTEEMRETCLRVRRTNCGVNGRTTLFYAQRRPTTSPPRPDRKTISTRTNADLLDGLRALGLGSVTDAQVEAAVRQLFPRGTDGRDTGEVLRAVFLRLKDRGSAA